MRSSCLVCGRKAPFDFEVYPVMDGDKQRGWIHGHHRLDTLLKHGIKIEIKEKEWKAPQMDSKGD